MALKNKEFGFMLYNIESGKPQIEFVTHLQNYLNYLREKRELRKYDFKVDNPHILNEARRLEDELKKLGIPYNMDFI